MDMKMFTAIGVQQSNAQHFDLLFQLYDRTCWLLKIFIKLHPLHTLIIMYSHESVTTTISNNAYFCALFTYLKSNP